MCTWSPLVIIDHVVINYQLNYKLFDGFDYYPGYGQILGSFSLEADTYQYNIHGLSPYTGYLMELKITSLPVNSSDYLIEYTSTVNITFSEGNKIIF